MKLERQALAHYLNATPSATSPSWYRIGKDVESMSVDLSSDIEVKKNILDETSVTHKGYQPAMSVDTYYADPSDSIYALLKGIAMGRLKGDDCKTTILELIVEDTSASSHNGYTEDVILEVSSYGGETGGIQIPYTVHFAGNRKAVSVTISGGVPTVTG